MKTFQPDAFDLRHGVQTAGIVPKWRLLLSSANARHGIRYQPIDETELLTALDFLSDDPAKLTFIDLGCGKGRALIVAERYGFQRVIGVEHKSTSRVETSNVRK